jgi:catechol 2,3-dioxygenase-like lactoylglutathione lyase family enzyme
MSQTEHQGTTVFGGVTPILRVASMEASLDYYTRRLGFNVDWKTSGFVSVSRGRCCIFLSQGDQGHFGAWVWIGVGDADALLQEYRGTGAKIRHLPTNYDWAYEVQVEDLDGNVLRFGSDPKKDEPVGEWLDMRGDRWVRSRDSEWTRVEQQGHKPSLS